MRFVTVAFLMLASVAQAQAPIPTSGSSSGLEGLVWNKWETKHFAVLSIDLAAGKRLRSGVESAREDVLSRWSLKGSDTLFCKLVCVPDPDMLRRLFGLKEPRCEVRRDASGKVELAAIWVDSTRMDLLPSLLLEADLLSGDLPAFVKRGVPILELPPDEVRAKLKSAPDSPCSSLLDEKKSADLAKADGKGFDASCALLCLMVRREYGGAAFGRASSGSASELPSRMGFRAPADMDSTFSRYRTNLLKDIGSGMTPDQYLGVGR